MILHTLNSEQGVLELTIECLDIVSSKYGVALLHVARVSKSTAEKIEQNMYIHTQQNKVPFGKNKGSLITVLHHSSAAQQC